MKRYFIWSLVMVPAFLPAIGQTVNPANQINWPLVTGSGAPSAACTAANYGQPYTDIAANKGYTCTPSGWVQTGGGGSSAFTSNIGVGANGSSAYAPVNEVNFKTTSGNTAFACQEDQNKGVWDVRCIRSGVSWSSNPSQALINTIQAAMCYQFTVSGAVPPQVNLPAGNFNLGGNISIPPGLDLEGVPGTEYGTLTNLITTDPTKPMITQAASQTFTCNGNTFTANTGAVTVGNISFHGAGSTNANDVGIMNATSGGTTIADTHNVAFQNFGGPGRTLLPSRNGQNSRGRYIFAASNQQWYYNGGSYNPSGFTDTNWHCSLELGDLDSQWDHLEVTGQLQDSGYYNRFYLSNVCLAGGRLTDSFIQIAPHLVLNGVGATTLNASNNRLDDAWWSAFYMIGQGDISNNKITGYCTSPTLNPTNFPSNPGGVSTDPNCSSISFEDGGMGGTVTNNNIVEAGGIWQSWPVWAIWFPPNVISQVPTIVQQPPNTLQFQFLGGSLGYVDAFNPGADVGQSAYDMTQQIKNNVGGTMHFNYFKHIQTNNSTPTTYNNFDGIYPDTYVTIYLNTNDTIINSGAFHTCTGSDITNAGLSWWWYINGFGLFQECAPGGGGGGGGGTISGLTAGFIPLAGGSTSLTANSPLDYGISNAGVVTVTKPLAVNDGTGLAGLFDGTEGTPPSGAANHDILWADATSHDLKMNNNNGGAANVVGIVTAGASGDNVRLGTGGKNIVSIGPPASSFTPTFAAGTGAGTGPTISFTSGANDDSGWINVTTGTSPAASASIVTILYGGTYSTIRKCSVDPANGAAGILTTSGRPYVSVSTSTISQFAITVGTTALVASTAYQWLYRCGT